jgi:hypothetical protein
MHSKTVIIGLILIFGVISPGFVSASGQIATETESSDMVVTAEGTPEGIHLSFKNIPEDTFRLFVSLWDITSRNQIQTSLVDFEGNELAELRKNGELACPFVQDGHEYAIHVYYFTGTEEEITDEYSVTVNATAGGGIYLTNNPLLYFNTGRDSVTLSSKPAFSEETINSQDALFDYHVMVKLDGGMSWGYGGHSNELTYDFPQMTYELNEQHGISGFLPVSVSMYCNLDYGAIPWVVGVAKTEEVFVLF